MKHRSYRSACAWLLNLAAFLFVLTAEAASPRELTPISTFNGNGAEILAFDPTNERIFVTNGADTRVDVIDLSNPFSPVANAGFAFLDVSTLVGVDQQAEPTSVDVASVGNAAGYVAVGVNKLDTSGSDDVLLPGSVALFNSTSGAFVTEVNVGFLPDSVAFSPSGEFLVVANEGEPDEAGNDQPGSISVIAFDGSGNVTSNTNLDFTSFDSQRATLISNGVRIFPGEDPSNDFEPEFATVSPDSSTAFVTLQEANAVAEVDLSTPAITAIRPMGLKDHSVAGNGLDASDRDGPGNDGAINIQTWPIFGLYMPDAIAAFVVDGNTFYITANEGDARSEEERVKDLTLDSTAFPNAAFLQDDDNLGRLEVSSIDGDTDGDNEYEQLFAYGARSFSIYDASGNQVYDSGDDLEQLTALENPTYFNSDNDENTFDTRSDAKGPEPEEVEIGTIDGRVYAFIGLERIGGVAVYDVTTPDSPFFVDYVNNRDFSNGLSGSPLGDSGPESIEFISASDSPISGVPMIAVSNEETFTTTLYTFTPNPFPQSVASGDPRADSVVLWTRVLDETQPNADITVDLEVLSDADFQDGTPNTNLYTGSSLTARDMANGCVKVKVDSTNTTAGLSAFSTYWYRFSFTDGNGNLQQSVWGRTKTAPSAAQDVEVQFATLNCQDYIGRYYNTIVDLVRTQPDLDFIIHLGDYVYETNGDPQFQTFDPARQVEFGPNAINLGSFEAAGDLSDYRSLYEAYRADPAMKRLHELYPMLVIWDDHEFANDHFQENANDFAGTENRPSGIEESPERKKDAEQAWFEFIPNELGINGTNTAIDFDIDMVSPTVGTGTRFQIFRVFDFGANCSVFLSDTRSYRPDHLIPEDAFPGTIVIDQATAEGIQTGLSTILDPYVNIDDPSQAVVKATVQGIVTSLAQASNLSPADASAYATSKVTGNISATFINALYAGASLTPPYTLSDLAGFDQGLSFLFLGKQGLFTSIGSRNGVVDPLYDIYAGVLFAGSPASQDLLGTDQLSDLTAWATTNPAGCKIFASSVSMQPMLIDASQFAALLPPELQALAQVINLNVEHWDGFPQYRQQIVDLLAANNVIVVSGDIHGSFVGNHSNLAGTEVLPEFTATSVSSETFGEIAEGVFESVLGQGNPLIALIAGSLDTLLVQAANANTNTEMVRAEATANGYFVGTANSTGFAGLYRETDPNNVDTNFYPFDDIDNADLPAFFTSNFEVSTAKDGADTFTLELLHVADQEASTSAIVDAPNLSAILNALRDQDLGSDGQPDNTLTLSSGDAFIPGIFYDSSEAVFGSGGIADIQIQNELGFQAIAFGNHEFDFGTAEVAALIDGSADGDFTAPELDGTALDDLDFMGTAFPYLSTNLNFSSDTNMAPLEVPGGQVPQPNVVSSSTVITVNGELIGVVGATTPRLASISSPGNIGISPTWASGNPTSAELDALAQIIQTEVDALITDNAGLDKIILLAHMQQLDIEREIAQRTQDIDIIVGGGSNTRLFDSNDRARAGDSVQGTYPEFYNNLGGTQTALVNTDGSYKYVGRLVLDFDSAGNIIPSSYDASVSGAYATDAQGVTDLGASGLIDPEIQAIADAIEAQIIATESNVFGVSDVFLNGNRSGTFAATDPDGVRTQETNLGNLTADANLAEARKTEPAVVLSLKNGGGIRASIGETIVPPGGSAAVRQPNSELVDGMGNVIKPEGGISQNDIATALSFNNGLVLLTLTKQEIVDLLEHGVDALPGVNGRFPQISGIRFSFDQDNPSGSKIVDAVFYDELTGMQGATLVENGSIVGDPNELFRIVTLDFLSAPRFDDMGNYIGAGDGYPFPNLNEDNSSGNELGDPAVIARVNRVSLVQGGTPSGNATFAADGSEQDAFAEYLNDNFNPDNGGVPFGRFDNGPNGDERIQNLNFRNGAVLPFTLELLHVADQEASTSAIVDAPNLSAVLNALRDQDLGSDGQPDNTLTLSSGDAFIPGIFYDSSEAVFGSGGIADIQIQNELGFQAIAFGNHEFDFGTAEVAALIDGSADGDFTAPELDGTALDDLDFMGTAFPYLSTNLNFATDTNMAPLEVPGGQVPQPNVVSSSTVITVNGEPVGVIGATTPTLASISSPGSVGVSPSPFDPNPTPAQLQALADEIQLEVDALLSANPGMNKVILLAHMQQLNIEREIAQRTQNIDIIVGGGSNTRLFDSNDRARAGDSVQGTYPEFYTNLGGTQTALVNTDGSYKYVGRLVLDFDAAGNIDPTSYDQTISGAYATDAQGVTDLGASGLIDPEIQAIADAIEAQIIATESNVFGVSDVFLNGNRSGTFAATDPDGVRTQETNLGNLTADANLAEARKTEPAVALSLKNGGGIRASIGETIVPPGGSAAVRQPNSELVDGMGNVIKPEGGISQNDIATALAFNNGLTLLTLTHEEIVDLLEHGVSALPGANGRFPQISGVRFSFDQDNPSGSKIVNATFVEEETGQITEVLVDNGVVQNPTATKRIVTLGFLVNPRFDDNGNFIGGGDGYPFPNLNEDNSMGNELGDPAIITRVDRIDLDMAGTQTGNAVFAEDGTEQDALAEYLNDNFNPDNGGVTFGQADVGPSSDVRIQNLNFRPDTITGFTLELLHVADQEAGGNAVVDAPNLSAVLNALRDQDIAGDGVVDNTMTLSSGDAFIPGLFYDASEAVFGSSGIADIQIQNELGFQAIAFGNHEFDFGTAELAALIDGSAPGDFTAPQLDGTALDDLDFMGTAFPYLSTNLNFSTDANMAPLEVPGGQAPQPNVVTSSTIIGVNGESVLVVGATTPTLATIASPGNVGINPSPFSSPPTPAQLDALALIIQNEVDAQLSANPGINKVILLAHMQVLDVEREIAQRTQDIDIIVGGGSNTRLFDSNDRPRAGDSVQGTYPEFYTNLGGSQTALVNTDGSYKYVGRLVLDFDIDGEIIPGSYDETVSGAYATDAQGVTDLGASGLVDPEVQAIADAIEAQIIATESNVFGISTVFLNGNRSGTFAPDDPDGVRTQETNLGNLTADANLAEARKTEPAVTVSLKNGGGIRASIGETVVPPGGSSAVRQPNSQLVDGMGNVIKPEGGISQNDIQTALAFNNGLTLLTLTHEEIVALLEHGVAQLPGVGGRFPQIAGLEFSFDQDLPPNHRIGNVFLVNSNGVPIEIIAFNGEVVNPNSTKRIVTLNFLANPRFDDDGNFTTGGDGYPFPNTNTDPQAGEVGDPSQLVRINRVDLVMAGTQTGAATFADDGSEQDALAEYLNDNFNTPATAYSEADTGPNQDERIRNTNFRSGDFGFSLSPLAKDDTFTLAVDSGLTSLNVLANDTDFNGDPLTITAVGTSSAGAPVAVNGSAIDYTPAGGFAGTDIFTYTVTDGTTPVTAMVTVNVVETFSDFLAANSLPGGTNPSDFFNGTNSFLDAFLFDLPLDGNLDGLLPDGELSGSGYVMTYNRRKNTGADFSYQVSEDLVTTRIANPGEFIEISQHVDAETEQVTVTFFGVNGSFFVEVIGSIDDAILGL